MILSHGNLSTWKHTNSSEYLTPNEAITWSADLFAESLSRFIQHTKGMVTLGSQYMRRERPLRVLRQLITKSMILDIQDLLQQRHPFDNRSDMRDRV